MGNDGGTIAKRQDILSLHSYGRYGANEKIQIADDNESSILTTCALSSLPLYGPEEPPVVSDFKGKLYLKEKALEYIIKRKSSNNEKACERKNPSPFSHIRSMNDLVDLHIRWKTTSESSSPSIECPISKELKNSNTVYAYLRPCGCVLSFKILEAFMKYFGEKTIKSDSILTERDCPNCGKMFCFKYDVVILNPLDVVQHKEFNERSLNYLQESMQLTHSKRPRKIKKKRKDKSQANDTPVSDPRKRCSMEDESTSSTKKTKL